LATHDPYAALRVRNFLWLILGYATSTVAREAQIVVVGWQVFQVTRDPLALGMIGLAEALRSRGCRLDFVLGAASEDRLFGVLDEPAFHQAPAKVAALALLLLIALGIGFGRRRLPPVFWATLVGLVVLMATTRLAPAGFLRQPDESRYLYPEAFLLLIALGVLTFFASGSVQNDFDKLGLRAVVGAVRGEADLRIRPDVPVPVAVGSADREQEELLALLDEPEGAGALAARLPAGDGELDLVHVLQSALQLIGSHRCPPEEI